MWSWDIILALLAVGSAAGFIAGLFGVGGGTLVVPVVLWALQLQGVGNHPYAQHLAIGTSFAVMVFTTFSSMYAQHKKHAIDWATVRRMTPGMIFGVLLGAVTAKYMPTLALQVFFIAFLTLIALKTLRDSKPTPSRTLPALPGLTAAGTICGAASSWVRIGGGSLSVPAHRAIGTSSGLAWPIAVAGTIGYFANGLPIANLPEGTAGFIYLPAVAILSVATILFAPLGVKTAHKLPARKLKIAFGIMLLLIAAKMTWNLIH